jgi:hypothetical protein
LIAISRSSIMDSPEEQEGVVTSVHGLQKATPILFVLASSLGCLDTAIGETTHGEQMADRLFANDNMDDAQCYAECTDRAMFRA